MNYEIIPIQEKHIEGFWAAVVSVCKERKYLAFLEGPPIEMSRAFVLDNIKNNRPHYVAICDDQVVGWCDITSLNRPVYAHSGSLGIGVLSKYRGHGIGESLMRAALERAKQIGLTRVELTVREHNAPATSLYNKLGFAVEGMKRNGLKIDDQYENLIMMAILL
jgi:ribosomal protein S18 acetylase RimI-like enzyme